jgi:hypothetical protein
MVSNEELKSQILYKLATKRKWGESHTAIENLSKGIPSHFKGTMKKLAHELIREGLIVLKPTGYGQHVSLNVEKRDVIKRMIYKYLEKEI